MTDDDEELCPVCDSTCTCNHQPKDRGSARANGYIPKGARPIANVAPTPGRGKGQNYVDSLNEPSPSRSSSIKPSILPPESPSAAPLKIRLILGQRKQSGGTSPPSPTRRKRSIDFTSSSSDGSSSDASSKGKARAIASGSAPSSAFTKHSVRPLTQDTSSRVAAKSHASSSSRKRPSNSRPLAAGPSSQAPLSSKGAGPSKPGPSSAWFLGAPPPKLHKLKASRKPVIALMERGHSAASPSSIAPPRSHIHGTGSSGPKYTGPYGHMAASVPRSMPKPSTKINKSHSSNPKSLSTPLRNNKSSASPKKRRRLDYTPSPSPAPRAASSTDDEFREGDYLPQQFIRRNITALGSRGRAAPSSSAGGGGGGGGVTLGRPVGLVIPTFVPKPFSSSSSSSSQNDTDNISDDGVDDGGEDAMVEDLDDPDEDIQEEEERMILKEERKREKIKKKKEDGHTHGSRKQPKVDADLFGGSDLTSLSSSRGSSPASASSSSSSSSSSEEEDDGADSDDEDEMDEDEPDVVDAATWSQSEEDDTDADLFFANFLSDGQEEDEEEQYEKPIAIKVDHDKDVEDNDNPMADFGFGINEGEVFVDADALALIRRRRPHSTLHRGRGGRKHAASGRNAFEQPLIVANSDGHLVFADAWDAEDGFVNTEWEKAQLAVMLNDEDVTSEESEAANDDEEAGGGEEVAEKKSRESTETETDFEGDTTVDEGLDEDGLPPAMASQSQQHRSEREFNIRRLREEHGMDIPLPIPENLPPGVEVFEGGYSTVMFGRFDFPSTQPFGEGVGVEFGDVWEGIKDEHETSLNLEPEQAMIIKNEDTVDPSHTNILMSPVTHMASSVRDVLSLAPSVGVEGNAGLGITATGDNAQILAPSALPLNAPITDTNRTGSPEVLSDAPPTPPRKLPVMGSFRLSPPRQAGDAGTGTGTGSSSTIPSEESAMISSISSLEVVAATPRKRMAIIDGRTHATIPSPFANLKRRKKPRMAPGPLTEESDGSVSMSQRSDWYFGQDFSAWSNTDRGRKPAVSRSARSSFSQSFPPLGLNIFTSPGMGRSEHPKTPASDAFGVSSTPLFSIPTVPPASMDLADVLDSAFLDEGDMDMTKGIAVDEDTSVDQATLRNLTRWERVPMGTFRHSRVFSMGGSEIEAVSQQPQSSPRYTSDGFSYGAIARPPVPLTSALWSEGTDIKGKGKAAAPPESKKRKRRKLVVSPTLLPIKDNENPLPEPEEMDVDMTGLEEEEGYFSKQHHKEGREGTERERMRRKFEEKEKRSAATLKVSPLHARVKHGAHSSEELSTPVERAE